MATITPKTDSNGKIISYKATLCVGRDEHNKQIWRTKTFERPDGLTPVKERKEIERQVDMWAEKQKAEFERTHEKQDKSRITLSEFVNAHWWPDHVMDGSHTPNSISFYKHMSDDIISYFGTKKRLALIDAEAVKRYIKFLNTEATTKGGKPLSATTIVRHYQTLRNILNYALRFGYLKDDPCKYLSVKDKPHKENKSIDFLEPKDAQRFIKYLEREPLFWRCFMNVLITTGLRRGECVGLQWGDIDGDKLTVNVSRNVTVDAESTDKYHIGSTKTGESRTVPISLRVYSLLMELKHENEQRFGAALMPSAFVFCSMYNPYKPIYPTAPTKWQAKFVERNNLPNVSPHDLRHTAATLALESGSDLKQVQALLGHKDPATTMEFYAGVTEEAQRRTVDGIESIIMNK